MSGPDIAGVVERHGAYEWWPMTREFICTCEASIGTSYPDPAHRAHLTDAIRAEMRAWLESEGAVEAIARMFWPHGRDLIGWWKAEEDARAVLAALAEQVAGGES